MTVPPSLVQELLADQQNLTAVEQFSRAHDEQALAPGSRYRDLIPLEAPRPGEQYAFEVDLDKCSGCKACVTACHSLNGLDDNETWREVGLLIEPPKRRRGTASYATPQSSTLQHVTTACHHCVDPACLNGCPVLAYEKDSVTGIVRHLDDQCIGCQYCVLKCPYDVPKYNDRLGIVRKCDMCSHRLAAGEAPACVQACPNEAIRITTAVTDTVTIQFRERQEPFLSGTPEGDYTLPTTRYISAAPHTAVPLVSADAAMLRPQPAHWPLVLMLVLSQASVGAACAGAYASAGNSLLGVALALGVASISASVFHLGRPLGAWRFFLGLRRSWLSREILLFGLYVPMLALAFFCKAEFQPALASAAAAVGVIGVCCSMMIYHDTRRALWNWRRSAAMFFGSTAALGCCALLALDPSRGETLSALVIAVAAKLLVEISVLRHVTDRELTPLKKTALLITGPFQWLAFGRLALTPAAFGAALLLHMGAIPSTHTALAWLPFTLAFAGEILERILFFRAVDAPKMPGGLPA
jgi:formate dehydrogenase iron-sulfur subunit